MRLRALFGHFYREGIRIKLGKHFKFQGGLHRVVQNHYRDVRTKGPDDYGNRPNRGNYDLDEEHKLCDKGLEGTLDLEDLTTLQMLCCNALSTCCCLRGVAKILQLNCLQLDLEYKAEEGDYEGDKALRIINLVDKTCNLGINNSYTRDDMVGFLIVKNPNDVL